MKHFAFISDFDGTLTERDFYHILIDKYLGAEGRKFYMEWKKKEKINVPFLNRIFEWSGLTEEALKEEILKLPFDKDGKKLIDEVRSQGGDFYIVSAGTSYYIKIFLEYLGLSDVEVISMPAKYKEGHLTIEPDEKNPYFSKDFGLDKRKVLETLKKEKAYDFIYFAGDSEPDLTATYGADVAFTKGELSFLINENKQENKQGDKQENGIQIPVENCGEMLNYILARKEAL